MSKRSIQRTRNAKQRPGAWRWVASPVTTPAISEGGSEGPSNDDRGGGRRTVPGAFGGGEAPLGRRRIGGHRDGGAIGRSGITGDIDAAARAARQRRGKGRSGRR